MCKIEEVSKKFVCIFLYSACDANEILSVPVRGVELGCRVIILPLIANSERHIVAKITWLSDGSSCLSWSHTITIITTNNLGTASFECYFLLHFN